MTRFAVALTLAASLVAAPSPGQRLAETVEVRIIEVPVHVLDGSGQAVRGLLRGDFELRVNGEPHPIEYFEVLDIEAPEIPSAGEEGDADLRIRRRTLILFDLVFGSLRGITLGAKATEDYIRTAHSDDLIAVATYRTRGIEYLTPFTRDRALALLAVRTLKTLDSGDPLRLTMHPRLRVAVMDSFLDPGGRSDGAEAAPGWLGAVGVPLDDIGDMGPRPFFSDDALVSEMAAEHGARFVRAQIRAVRSIAEDLAPLDGQKQLLILSEGFESNSLLRDPSLWQEYLALQNTVRRNGVILHTLNTAPIGRTLTTNRGQSLFALAHESGGLALANRNQIAGHFEAFRKSQTVTYLLAFRPPDTAKPGTNAIEVRLREKERSWRVLARRAFAGTGDALAQTENSVNLELAEIILDGIRRDDVRLSLRATSSSAGEVVEATLPAVDLLVAEKPDSIRAWLLTYVFEAGEIREMKSRHLGLDLNRLHGDIESDGDPFGTARLRFRETFDLPPGRYEIRALFRLMDQDVVGFASAPLVVE
ncbi:MAG TPA: VWA domain-containing protein [Thermoanaerobaculia bacterium]|nr:VWA domain-containing protein [Thermoanaerobaculia bacterium]